MIQTNLYFPFCVLSYTSEQLYPKEGYTAWKQAPKYFHSTCHIGLWTVDGTFVLCSNFQLLKWINWRMTGAKIKTTLYSVQKDKFSFWFEGGLKKEG